MNFSTLSQKLKQVIIEGTRRFPESVIAHLAVFVVIAVMIIGRDDLSPEQLHKLGHLLVGIVSAWLVALTLRLGGETRASLRLRFLPAIAAVITCGAFFFVYANADITNLFFTAILHQQRILLGTVGIYMALIAASLYFMAREISAPIFPVVKLAIAKSFLASSVIALMLYITVLAFFSLLLNNNFYWEKETVTDIIFAFSYTMLAGQLFLSFLPSKNSPEPVPPLFEKFLSRLLFPTFLLLLTVLYAYIGKIILTLSMPVGQMNWFASLAVLGFAFFYLSLHGKEEYSRVAAFIRWGLLIFTPIIIVQLIGVWIRYDAYGLTSARYASLICAIVGIFTLWLAFRRRSPQRLYLVIAACSLIFTLTPLNIIDIPLKEQDQRLQRLLADNNMLVYGTLVPNSDVAESTRAAIVSAARYAAAAESPLAREVLDEPIFADVDDFVSQYQYILFRNPRKNIPIAGYSKALTFDTRNVSSEGLLTMTDDAGKLYTINLMPYADELKRKIPEPITKNADQIDTELLFAVDENTLVYLQYCNLDIPKNDGAPIMWNGVWGVILLK